MNQQSPYFQTELFSTDFQATDLAVLPRYYGSASGSSWQSLCQARLQQYGFHLRESRPFVGDAIEIDGHFRNQRGLCVMAEYKERINAKVFREVVGQAVLVRSMLRRTDKMVIIVLTGHIDENLAAKPGLINAASDHIYYIGNPQTPQAETFLKQLATVEADRTGEIVHLNLSSRIQKMGGFAGLNWHTGIMH
jgi:hypothetical protein